jgi:hypothetical protein
VTLTSTIVTAEDAARWDGSGTAAILAVAGEYAEFADGTLWIWWKDGTIHDVPEGYWVVRYSPGDIGIVSPGAFRRYFPDAARLPA